MFDSQVVQRLVEASVEAGEWDSVPAILTVPGCKANRGVQAICWGGCLGPDEGKVEELELELELQLEQGPELELVPVAGKDGTGCPASRVDRTALELELELQQELEQELELELELEQELE